MNQVVSYSVVVYIIKIKHKTIVCIFVYFFIELIIAPVSNGNPITSYIFYDLFCLWQRVNFYFHINSSLCLKYQSQNLLYHHSAILFPHLCDSSEGLYRNIFCKFLLGEIDCHSYVYICFQTNHLFLFLPQTLFSY